MQFQPKSPEIFMKLDKLILKLEKNKVKKSQNNLKRNKMEKLVLSKTYYKTIVIKTVWSWHRNKIKAMKPSLALFVPSYSSFRTQNEYLCLEEISERRNLWQHPPSKSWLGSTLWCFCSTLTSPIHNTSTLIPAFLTIRTITCFHCYSQSTGIPLKEDLKYYLNGSMKTVPPTSHPLLDFPPTFPHLLKTLALLTAVIFS